MTVLKFNVVRAFGFKYYMASFLRSLAILIINYLHYDFPLCVQSIANVIRGKLYNWVIA